MAPLYTPSIISLLLKRCMDVCLAVLGILISAPLWVCIAVGIKLGDGGPIFYCQDRVGKNGRRFTCWKFRSMVEDTGHGGTCLPVQKMDARVTRVGRFLRATAFDELPQLWNILVGEMSFVGPRALMPEEIEVTGDGILVPLEKIPGYKARHQVKPGLTGIAQVYAPRDLPRRHKFKYDLLYIKKQTFRLDIKLILFSLWICCLGKCEHRGWKYQRSKAETNKSRTCSHSSLR